MTSTRPAGARTTVPAMARRVALRAAVSAVATAGIAGCAGPLTVEPGPSATTAACAQVLVALPSEYAGLPRRETTSQATAAWGQDPADAVQLRCGIDPPGPTTDLCTTVGEVDWVVDDVEGLVRYRSFGRIPAVEVTLPADRQDGLDVLLSSLAAPMSTWQRTRTCG